MGSEQPGDGLSARTAVRHKRPTWKDPRLALGIVLVVASTAGTVVLIEELNSTTGVYVSTRNITLGEQLNTDNLRTEEVRLGELTQNYLPADPKLLEGVRSNGFIAAGQLIPRNAVARSELGSRRPINVDQPLDLSPAITAGSFVDVWIAEKADRGQGFNSPHRLAEMVEVSRRTARDGGLVGQGGTNLELLVEPDYLDALLQALANESRIIVVYNPLGERS
ncbi:flagellar protein FlgA [Glutamicibacter endophyticus]